MDQIIGFDLYPNINPISKKLNKRCGKIKTPLYFNNIPSFYLKKLEAVSILIAVNGYSANNLRTLMYFVFVTRASLPNMMEVVQYGQDVRNRSCSHSGNLPALTLRLPSSSSKRHFFVFNISQVTYIKGCGVDNKCETDLVLSVTHKLSRYVEIC